MLCSFLSAHCFYEEQFSPFMQPWDTTMNKYQAPPGKFMARGQTSWEFLLAIREGRQGIRSLQMYFLQRPSADKWKQSQKEAKEKQGKEGRRRKLKAARHGQEITQGSPKPGSALPLFPAHLSLFIFLGHNGKLHFSLLIFILESSCTIPAGNSDMKKKKKNPQLILSDSDSERGRSWIIQTISLNLTLHSAHLVSLQIIQVNHLCLWFKRNSSNPVTKFLHL